MAKKLITTQALENLSGFSFKTIRFSPLTIVIKNAIILSIKPPALAR